MEDVDHIHEKIHFLNSYKINVRGTLDAKAASTNESVRSWDVNVNLDMSPSHVVSNFKVQMLRQTPGEKNLKVRSSKRQVTVVKLLVIISHSII